MRPGDRLGPAWVVTRRVARGPHGTLLQCRDEARGTTLAVKLVRADPSVHDRRFQREIEALAQLDHPHVVRYLGHGETADGRAYLAMEWVDGPDLATYLATERPAPEEARAAALGVARALAAAHEQGLIHRDIKPGNLMLPGGQLSAIKVLDFGIARALGQTRLTATGLALGTAGYMAPEQLVGVGALGPEVDVFALGCVLFEMLTGSPALAPLGEGGAAPQRLRDHAPHLAPALDALLAAFMAEDPAARPADGRAALAALLALPAVLAPPSPALRPSPVRPPSATRRVASAVLVSGVDARGSLLGALEALAPGLGVRALESGDIALVAPGEGGAGDAASRAVDAALALRAREPRLRVRVVSGLVAHLDGAPLAVPGPELPPALRLPDGLGAVPVSPVTARLLSGHHAVSELAGLAYASANPRWTPRHRGPCVGRERELLQVVTAAQASAEEGVLRCLVVVGPPGSGKSRLLHEAQARCAAAGIVAVEGTGWRRLPEGLGLGAPAALFVDVGQGRGGACLEDVEQCFRQAEERGLLVVIAVRAGLEELPPALAERPGLSLTRLGPLSRAAGRRLAESLLAPGPASERLAERALGNPYVLEELAMAGWQGQALPLSVLALAQHELDALPVLPASVLAAVSVLDGAFPLEALAELTGLPAASAAGVAGLLVARGALRAEQGGAQEALSVRDELLRRAARAALTRVERRRLHHLAAAFLERLGPDHAAAVEQQRLDAEATTG